MLGFVRRPLVVVSCLALVIVGGVVWWGWDTYRDRCGADVDDLDPGETATELQFELRAPDDIDLAAGLGDLAESERVEAIQQRTDLLDEAQRLEAPFGDLVGVDFAPPPGSDAGPYVTSVSGEMMAGYQEDAVIGMSPSEGSVTWAGGYGSSPEIHPAGDLALVKAEDRDGYRYLVTVDPSSGETVACIEGTPAWSVASSGDDLVLAAAASINGGPEIARADSRTGEVTWSVSAAQDIDDRPGVEIADDLTVVGANDLATTGGLDDLGGSAVGLGYDRARGEVQPGSEHTGSSVVAYAMADGEEVWRFPEAELPRRDEPWEAASVVGSESERGLTVLLAVSCVCERPNADPEDQVMQARLVAVDTVSGEQKWTHEVPMRFYGSWEYAAVWDDHVVFDPGENGRLYAVRLDDGERAWTRRMWESQVGRVQNAASEPVGREHLIASYRQVRVIDPASGASRVMELPRGGLRGYRLRSVYSDGIVVLDDHIVLDYNGATLVFERSD